MSGGRHRRGSICRIANARAALYRAPIPSGTTSRNVTLEVGGPSRPMLRENTCTCKPVGIRQHRALPTSAPRYAVATADVTRLTGIDLRRSHDDTCSVPYTAVRDSYGVTECRDAVQQLGDVRLALALLAVRLPDGAAAFAPLAASVPSRRGAGQ